MTDNPGPTADYYRETAARLLAFARETRFPEVRIELSVLADRFERMARYVEQHYPHRRGILPSEGEPDNS
jgi:hypothetical protein